MPSAQTEQALWPLCALALPGAQGWQVLLLLAPRAGEAVPGGHRVHCSVP